MRRPRATLTHDKLVDEARFILRNLQRSDVFGDRVQLPEAERVLEPSLSLGFAEFVGFLSKYGYVRVDPETRTVTVTSGGSEAAESDDNEFHARLARHFAPQLTAAAGRPRSEPSAPPAAVSPVEGAPSSIGRSRRPLGTERPHSEEVLDRRYRRGTMLGRGALGTVHRGVHVGLGRPIALKEASTVFQYASYLRRDEIVRRLRTAVEAHARLSHPYVVQVLDQNPEREHPYVVMELAAGGNLRLRLDAAEGRQLPLPVAVRAFLQIAYALRHAHRQEVLHLGLKPENVLFDGLGNVKLVDFGMSRILEHPEDGGPAPVLVGGNAVGYFPPERLQPGATKVALGPSADIYALGILFYEMISGRLPGRRSPLPSRTREGIPEAFDEVFDKMTRDALDERYAAVDEVLEDVYRAFGPELVFEKGTMLAWADDPSPVPGLAEAEPEPIDDRDLEPMRGEDADPFRTDGSGDIAADLPIPAGLVVRRAPAPPPPPRE